MISFKKYLLSEGGNVKFLDSGTNQFITPDKLEMTNRKAHQLRVSNFVNGLNDHFIQKTGNPILGTSSGIYSGSTRPMMDKSIKNEDFVKYKKETGDVDLVTNSSPEHILHHLKVGHVIGGHTIKYLTKNGAKQVSVLAQSPDGKHYQFDLETGHYDSSGEPDKWSSFSKNSDWKDIQHGMKGMHHKSFLRTLLSRDGKKTLSIDYGVRDRVYNEKGQEIKSPKGVKYDTNMNSIFKSAFGRNPKGNDLEHFGSVVGLTHLMKKYIPKAQHPAIKSKLLDVATNDKNFKSENFKRYIENNL